MLVRDLTLGSVIRQHRPTDYAGNFLRKPSVKRSAPGQAPRTAKSAFDETDPYELTDLGTQFVHYAMTEITAKIEFQEFGETEPADKQGDGDSKGDSNAASQGISPTVGD